MAVLKAALMKTENLKHSITVPQKDPLCQRLPLAVRDFKTALVRVLKPDSIRDRLVLFFQTKLEHGLTGAVSFEADGRRKEFEMFVFENERKKTWNKVIFCPLITYC